MHAQMTGAELKASFFAALKRREAGQTLQTRAMREKAAGASGSGNSGSNNTATVRVRFPEGVCLQGVFAVREPAGNISEWVSCSLRDPSK